MILIRKHAYARAGLLGNPSDGYNGKTISFIVRNFSAEVVLYEWDTMEIVLSEQDRARFRSVQDLVRDVELHGYYGGIRLIKATIKGFVRYCERQGLKLHGKNFSIRYRSNIPRQVGLAGSSALIVATLRCLLEFYGVAMPLPVQPSFVLSVEREELGIAAGLQDRVIQCHEGLVYMDFHPDRKHMLHGYPVYHYESLDPALLPQVYVAYHAGLSEPTEVFHNDLRGQYERGVPEVLAAMQHFAQLAEDGRSALLAGDTSRLSAQINENFDTRRKICRLPDWQVLMVDTARACGASAKFAGSGGAIVGVCEDDHQFAQLTAALSQIGAKTVRPTILA